MDPQAKTRYLEIKGILDQLMDLPADQVQTRLHELCGSDPEKRVLAQALLDQIDQPTFAVDFKLAPIPPQLDGQRIGPYRLIRLIGEGGMGSVYEAVRDDGGFEQRVALKIMRRGLSSQEVEWRFHRERQILANLEHPHIARLLDGGMSAEGIPFFSMEFVQGFSLLAYCKQAQLDLNARLELFLQVLQAVQFAHQNLLIHRDLKPANILVTHEGQVKLLDFGIAKLLDQSASPSKTVTGRNPMTPQYAAPEQYMGLALTVACDIYALGLLLYELITETPAHDFPDDSPAAIERVIVRQAPCPPSQLLNEKLMPSRGHGLGYPAHQIRKLPELIRGELDAIVLQALRKEPDRRYVSAQAMADDIQNYLTGRPVVARGESILYLTRKFIRRNRAKVVLAGLTLLSLIAITLLSVRFGLVTQRQNEIIRRERDRAEQTRQFLLETFKAIDPKERESGELSARDLLDRGAARVDSELKGQPELRRSMRALLGELYSAYGSYQKAESLLNLALSADSNSPLSPREHMEWQLLLAQNYIYQSRLDEAQVSQQTAQQLAQKEKDPWLLAQTQLMAAKLNLAAKKWDQARQTAREAESLVAPADARYPAFRVDCLGVVAATYVETWETEQARPILEELVSYNRTTFGEKSFQYAHALGNLAMVEGFAQSFDLCFTHYLEVRDLLVPILGEKHLLIGDVYSSLSAFYTDAGRFEEGHKMGLLALDITQTLYGSDSPETITELNALGYNALCAENFAQANQYLSEAIAIGERALPANHPHLGNLYNLMCNLAARQGQLQDAIRWGEKSLKIHQSDPDQENDAAYSASMLAGIYLKLGKGESALPLAELAVQVARKRNDPVLYPLGEWLLKKGKALILVGQAAQAEICLREALDQMLALPEPPSEKVNEVLMHLKTVMTPERLAEWQALQNRAHALR